MRISSLTRGLIIAASIIGALISYGVGSILGVGLFIFIGVIFELAFWITIFSKK